LINLEAILTGRAAKTFANTKSGPKWGAQGRVRLAEALAARDRFGSVLKNTEQPSACRVQPLPK
jgi:hypothetical protein